MAVRHNTRHAKKRTVTKKSAKRKTPAKKVTVKPVDAIWINVDTGEYHDSESGLKGPFTEAEAKENLFMLMSSGLVTKEQITILSGHRINFEITLS